MDFGPADGSLKGIRLITSGQRAAHDRGSPTIERGLLIRIDPTAIVVGDGGVELDLSSQTSLQLDTAPTNITTGFGASPAAPTIANMVSLYQANATAIRCKRTVSWLKARPCVAYVSGINFTTA